MESNKTQTLFFDIFGDNIDSKKEYLFISWPKYKHKPIPAPHTYKTYSERCIIADYADLVKNPIENIYAVPQDLDYNNYRSTQSKYCWNLLLDLPTDCGMKREIYEAQLHFSTHYPLEPPTVNFIKSKPSSICVNVHPGNDFKIYVDHDDCLCDSATATRTKFDLRKYLQTVFKPLPKSSTSCSLNANEEYINVCSKRLRKRPKPGYIPGLKFLDFKRATPSKKRSLDIKSVTEEVNVVNTNVRNARIQRLLLDLKELENDAPLGITAKPYDHCMFIWDVYLPTPNDNVIEAKLYFNANYPFSPPKMYFNTRVFHPNVTEDREVCFEALKEAWNPKQTIWSLIASVQCLLSEPNLNNPVNLTAAAMLKQNPKLYHKTELECFENVENQESFKNTNIGKKKENIVKVTTQDDIQLQ